MVFITVMPAVNPGGSAPKRPPWVRDGPQPIPMPTAPWTLNKARERENSLTGAVNPAAGVTLRSVKADPERRTSTDNSEAPVRRQSKITIIPSRPSAEPRENGTPVASTVTTSSRARDPAKPVESKAAEKKQLKPAERQVKVVEEKPKPAEQKAKTPEQQPKVVEHRPRLETQKSRDGAPRPPQPPKPPAPPLPPPPPPGQAVADKAPVSQEKAEKLEQLRCRPRRRPDWGAFLKEVECGPRLKHVKCNDRSSPILPKVKVKDQFMYESEKPNVHNVLLKQIQSGVHLKRVQTNDRSKPQLDGLRKFRRQMTIEEQIQKAEAAVEEAAPEDELDDIDKVRDDLQSTKQMLALELRNREAVERENKRLLARLLNLEVEMEKERSAARKDAPPQARREEDEEEAKRVKKQLEEAQAQAEEMENKYHDVAGQLDMMKVELEEAKRRNQQMERRVSLMASKGADIPLTKQPSAKKIAKQQSAANLNANNGADQESEYEEVTETESSSEEDEEDEQAALERRNARELKLLATKLRSFKDKEETARKERRSLREQLKKQQKALKEERRKYKVLQKEVDKMAKLMKEDDEEEEDEEDEEEEEETESESESESEDSEEEDSEGELPPDAPADKRKTNLADRAKRHENILAALKKGNYLLKANIDRYKDDLFKQKEMSLTLQEDLDSVLSELG